jgi:cytochrome c peroxidase
MADQNETDRIIKADNSGPGHRGLVQCLITLFGSACAYVVLLAVSSPAVATDEAIPFPVPLGVDIDAMNVPDDNPITKEKIELGKMLYFDTRLSKDDTISCATCHAPDKGFTDQLRVSTGIRDQQGTRNAPTVINTAFNFFQFWDGREPTLEAQALGPIANPVEMGNPVEDATFTIAGIRGYAPLFAAAFGDPGVSSDRIAKAIASYERTVLSGNSAWDRYVYAHESDALSESAARGLALFEGKARCTQCHVGFNLTDGVFHNLGVGMAADNPDLGRYVATAKETDKGAFKTPTLRDLQQTAPYMHDGSVKTLAEVIELYNRGGEANPWLDPKMKPLDLSDQEKADLVAFMESLEGDWTPIEAPTRPN